ncbi:hypothetical protein KSP39_PZI016285 [Platanthera zijinensis]|uniref:Uncharacterized protein n=1 Tax=Platanthera zijinensis TaxID=2320716 RepID=A0AAP0G0Y8_9ASPA
MGGTAKWMKYLIIGLKKNENNNRATKEGSGSSKWKIRRSPSKLGNIVCHERKVAPVDFAAVVEAVVRAPLKDFKVLKREWAATRIQASFRGFLARRALRALKSVVRLQAIFRGQRVRKQAIIAFRSMEAVMRAQIRVRMQRVNMLTEGEEMQFVVMSSQNKVEKLKFKAAKPSTSALEVLSEKGHQHLHNINNGSLSFERGISAKPSKMFKITVKENNSITNNLTKTYPLNLQCKQNHRDLLTSASDFGFSNSPASSLSSSSSSISRPIL